MHSTIAATRSCVKKQAFNFLPYQTLKPPVPHPASSCCNHRPFRLEHNPGTLAGQVRDLREEHRRRYRHCATVGGWRTQVAGVPQDEPPWQGEYQIPSRCMYYSMHCVTNVVWCCILFLVLARHGRRVCFFGGGRRHSFLFFRFLENLIYDISRPEDSSRRSSSR